MSTSIMTDPSVDAARNEPTSATRLLACLPSATTQDAAAISQALAEALPEYSLTLSGPGLEETGDLYVPYPQSSHGDGIWALTGKDYLAAAQLALEQESAVTLVLGAEASCLQPAAFRSLVSAITKGGDFAAPRYAIGPHEGLVSSAILGPMTRALYAVQVHLPLPVDACFSLKMARQFSATARRTSTNAPDPLLWPVAEAAASSLAVKDVPVGPRTLPPPDGKDLNSLLVQVLGSFFADAEAKAAVWQRSRPAAVFKSQPPTSPANDAEPHTEDLQAMLESFRNAYDNLQEIWALVLPPQSLLRVKRISRATMDEFNFPADLWARVVYDFLMAFRQRSINRGHLLGAMTPLYLAWVTSHLHTSQDDAARAAAHVEETAAAFVAEKPYLVSRWRWPDRFNP